MTNQEQFEKWREEKLAKIWAMYDHIPEDERLEAMLPEHRSEFMSVEERLSEMNKETAKYKNKIKTDSSLYDVDKVNKDLEGYKSNKRTNEQIEKCKKNLIEYAEKLKEPTDNRRIYKPKSNSQLARYDLSRRVFFHQYLVHSFKNKDFIVDKDNKEIIKKLLMYFVRDPDIEDPSKVRRSLSLNKGIFLFGHDSTGKRNLMTQLSYFVNRFKFPNKFEIQPFSETIEACKDKKNLKPIHGFKGASFCHTGIYTDSLNLVGNHTKPLEYLIEQQFHIFHNTGRLTHFTISADLVDIQEQLSDRAFGMVMQMCNLVYLGGPSRI